MLLLFGRKSILHACNSLIVRRNDNVGWVGYGFITARLMSNKSEVEKLVQPNYFSSSPKMKSSRMLSTLNHQFGPMAANYTTIPKSDQMEFKAVFPDLLRELTETVKSIGGQDAAKWFARALQYNMKSAKLWRGIAIVLAFKELAKPEIITPDNLQLARYLGWCVELIQSSLLIFDDIMDGSETRRDSLCWYKVDDVKMVAINDGLMIENAVYMILEKYFRTKGYYVDLLDLLHKTLFITTIGESLDLQTGKKTVDTFTMELYKSIVINKSAYYSFNLPIALAMHLAGYTDPEVFSRAKTILIEMCFFFQVQNDFLDCFGDPNVTGKIGTDIQEGKCTWLSVVCMERADEIQKHIMRANYGRNEPDKIESIKKLYEELELPNAYAKYEAEASMSKNIESEFDQKLYGILELFWQKSKSLAKTK